MSATAYVSIHNVDRIRVSSYHPKNSNSIELRFVQDDGRDMPISVFGLPEDSAIELVKLLGDAETTVYADGEFRSLTEYLVAKGVFDAIEGK